MQPLTTLLTLLVCLIGVQTPPFMAAVATDPEDNFNPDPNTNFLTREQARLYAATPKPATTSAKPKPRTAGRQQQKGSIRRATPNHATLAPEAYSIMPPPMTTTSRTTTVTSAPDPVVTQTDQSSQAPDLNADPNRVTTVPPTSDRPVSGMSGNGQPTPETPESSEMKGADDDEQADPAPSRESETQTTQASRSEAATTLPPEDPESTIQEPNNPNPAPAFEATASMNRSKEWLTELAVKFGLSLHKHGTLETYDDSFEQIIILDYPFQESRFPHFYNACAESLAEFDCLVDRRACNMTEVANMTREEKDRIVVQAERFKSRFRTFCTVFDQRTQKIENQFRQEIHNTKEAVEALQGLALGRVKRFEPVTLTVLGVIAAATFLGTAGAAWWNSREVKILEDKLTVLQQKVGDAENVLRASLEDKIGMIRMTDDRTKKLQEGLLKLGDSSHHDSHG